MSKIEISKLRTKNFNYITQNELHDFYRLEQQFLDIKNRYIAQRNKLILRIKNKASQEPGKYAITTKVFHRRSIAYKSILVQVKGKNWVENLIKNQPVKTYTKLEFVR